jgi:hypothetical protein
MSGKRKAKVRETWLTTFDLSVSGSRMLWLIGTTKHKWVPLKRFKIGDRVRVTVQKIEGKNDPRKQ